MFSFRVRVALSLQLTAVLALTSLVETRHTPSKYFDEMMEINRRSQPNYDADPVQKFLDVLRIPPRQRPSPSDVPSIYDFLEMPSIESANAQKIAFSATKPSYSPAVEVPPMARDRRSRPYPFYKKSAVNSEETLRACPANSQWKQIESATTLENDEVIIGTRQWFWQTTCLDEDASCYGFIATPHMTSSCRPVFSWVVAWARPVAVINYTWRFIALKTCCSCAVSINSPIR